MSVVRQLYCAATRSTSEVTNSRNLMIYVILPSGNCLYRFYSLAITFRKQDERVGLQDSSQEKNNIGAERI